MKIGGMIYRVICAKRPTKEIFGTKFLCLVLSMALPKSISRAGMKRKIALLLALVAPTVFLPIMKQPSPKALQLMADIEGFGMYIKAAETEKLGVLNPPDRTPQEFERVMPYAVALGLEHAWGAKFTDLAAQLHFNGSLGTLDEFQHRLDGI